MTNLANVYRRECSSYFNSPIAYIVIVAFLLFMSLTFFFLLGFFSQPSPAFRPYFDHFIPFGLFSVLVIPAITMRLWSEEKKQGTIELLMTLPIKTWELVMAKFLAGLTVVALALLLTVTVPISVSFLIDTVDWGTICLMYVGMLSVSFVTIALGSCISALTENQIVALLSTMVISAVLCAIGFPTVMSLFDTYFFNGLGEFLGSFGTYFHYQNFAKGLFSAVDVVYAVSMTGLFILLNNIAVEGRKY